MGQVYLAEDMKLRGKQWAVKECTPLHADVDSVMEEAHMLAQLHHPQLPQLVDFFATDDGRAYLVMDYIPGPNLQHLFEEGGRTLPVTAVINISMQVCELFHYLHSFQPQPIIYRDLKPANVMLGVQDQIRLIDFGIARHYTQGQQADTMQIGTIGFAAPEQFAGLQTDVRSDLYTIGAMMYYLLSGGQHAYIAKLPLQQVRTDLPPLLTDTVHMLLEENPQLRCQTAMELKKRLQGAYEQLMEGAASSASSAKQSASFVADKLVIVGGLYAGAGATFAAMSIARVLNAAHIPHALVEHPVIEPDLYMLLYGDHKAPKDYAFAAETLAREPQQGVYIPWKDQYTTWVPNRPDGNQRDWRPAEGYKLLHAIKSPITLWDVGTSWTDPSVQELCHSADEIVVILDASPGKLCRPRTKDILQLLDSYRKRGKQVRFAANRQTAGSMHPEWLESLPQRPCCTIPEIPHHRVMRAVWKGACVQDTAEVLDALRVSLAPLLHSLAPKAVWKPQSTADKSFFKRFKRYS